MNRPNKEREQNGSYQRGRGRRAERVKRIDGTVREVELKFLEVSLLQGKQK